MSTDPNLYECGPGRPCPERAHDHWPGADPDQGDHADLLADLDYYGDDRHVATVDERHALLRAAAVALRTTLAQRDEARQARNTARDLGALRTAQRDHARARVAELEAAGEKLMSTTAKSTPTWRSDRVAANDARKAWRALVPTAPEPPDRWTVVTQGESATCLLDRGTVAAVVYRPWGEPFARQLAALLNAPPTAPNPTENITVTEMIRHAVSVDRLNDIEAGDDQT